MLSSLDQYKNLARVDFTSRAISARARLATKLFPYEFDPGNDQFFAAGYP